MRAAMLSQMFAHWPSSARLGLGLALAAAACSSSPAPAPETPAAEAAPSNSEPAASEVAPAEPLAENPGAPAAEPATAQAPAASAGTADTRTPASIQAVVQANRQKVRDCYDKALKTNPGIVGDLVVSFVVDPQGKVKQAEVNWAESDIHVPELDTCAAEAIRSLTFPASSKGLESKVNYPFNLNPKFLTSK
jgi:outer membrane biosynthesis protein TonB